MYHETMVTIQRSVPTWCLTAAILVLTVTVGHPAAAQSTDAEVCPGVADGMVTIAATDGWRTLVTTDGTRLLPAGIADFGVIEPESPDIREAAAGALESAFRHHMGKPLGVRYLSDRNDRRGRRPVLFYHDGRLIQQRLIEEGQAIAFPFGGELPCASEFLGAEGRARAAGHGYWNRRDDWISGPRSGDFLNRINRFAIFEAKVVSVGTRTSRTYLNFGGRWATDVTVEIPERSRAAFGGAEALEALQGRRIRVRGFAVEKSGPMIEVRRPWQIEVLTNPSR
jgi:endonuclease YncB( thermonuclease family)